MYITEFKLYLRNLPWVIMKRWQRKFCVFEICVLEIRLD